MTHLIQQMLKYKITLCLLCLSFVCIFIFDGNRVKLTHTYLYRDIHLLHTFELHYSLFLRSISLETINQVIQLLIETMDRNSSVTILLQCLPWLLSPNCTFFVRGNKTKGLTE